MFEMIRHFYIGFHSGERLELIKPVQQVKNESSDDEIFKKNYGH